MSVTEHTPISTATGDGVSLSAGFAFPVLDEADLKVKVAGVLLTLNVDYTVAGVGNPAGGTVTFTVAPANGAAISLYRDSVLQRETDYQTAGDFRAETVNPDFDRLWLVMMEIVNGSRGAASTLRAPSGETLDEFPNAAGRLDRLVAFNATSGQAELSTFTATQVASAVAAAYAAGSTADAVTFLQSGTGAASRSVQSKQRELVSITDFGAVSGTIVTTAVNYAIAAAAAAGKKGIFFPAGTWYLDAGITWSAGVNWYGEGVESTRIDAASFASASGLPMVTITSAPGWRISGIRFEGSNKASGIKATDSYWGRMEMCHVNGIKGKGVELIESAGTVLDQVSMYYFSAATDYGVFLAGGSAVDLRSCYLNTEAIALAADTATVSGAICRGVMFEGNAVAVRWPLNQNVLVLDGCFFEGIGSSQEVLEIGEHGSGTKPDIIARGNIIASTLNNVVTISNATRVVWEGNTTGKNVNFTSGIDRLWHGRGNNYAGGSSATLSAQLFIDDDASGSVKYSSAGNDVLVNQYTDATKGSLRAVTNAAASSYKPETVSCSHFALDQAGSGHRVKEGSNCKQGTATLVGGTVTVANTAVTANSRIFLTSQSDGGTPGFLRVSARVAGTSFTITSSSGTDTSTVAYEIFEPA